MLYHGEYYRAAAYHARAGDRQPALDLDQCSQTGPLTQINVPVGIHAMIQW